jgi:hypothetical protein
LLILGAVIHLSSCNRPQESRAGIPLRWSADALELAANESPAAALAKSFEDAFDVRKGKDKAQARDCASVFRVLAAGYQTEFDRDLQVLLLTGLRCRALEDLAKAKPAQTSYLSDFHLEAAPLNMLPAALASVVSGDEESARKKAIAQGASWADYDPKAKVLTENKANENATALEVATAGDFAQRLEKIASGDFDGDGVEDWLITDESYARQGTYRASRMVLVTRKGPNEPLRVIRELMP